jgi:hypothetical protein
MIPPEARKKFEAGQITPYELRNVRNVVLGLTMQEAADLVGCNRLTWLRYERNPDHKDFLYIPKPTVRLFAILTGLIELPDTIQAIKKARAKNGL